MPRIIIRHCASPGSSTLTTWKRRLRAGSFSKYFLYSDQVVAAIVRSSPRARAGLSRLAASPWPACPPAPMSVWASSMKRMIGVGRGLDLLDQPLSRFSNSPLTPAPACSSARSSAADGDVAQRRRDVTGGDARGEALDDGRLADAGLAGEDRVVLAAAQQDVDHLADLEVAAEHRVDLAVAGGLGEVLRELVEVGRLAAARAGFAGGRGGRFLGGGRCLLLRGRDDVARTPCAARSRRSWRTPG